MRCDSCVGGDGNWPCVMRRHVGKGIQGACAPMAERCGGRFAAPGGAAGAAGGAIGDLGALRALGGAR